MFHNLSHKPEMQEKLMAAGVVSSVAAAMEHHLEDADIKWIEKNFMHNKFRKQRKRPASSG